jgi:hypothetical protein
MKQDTEIKNSKHAQRESVAMKTFWSRESCLTQRVLIYTAGLLEQILKELKRERRRNPHRVNRKS